MTDPWPSLLIVGTQKAATTWLQRGLQRHPEVHMSNPKELYFFGRPGWDDPVAQAGYRAHFRSDNPGIIHRGEASTNYFWHTDPASPYSPKVDPHDDAARAIAAAFDQTPEILVLLRNPVDRAVAGANHHLTMGRFGPDDDIFTADPSWGIVDLGFYGRHLRHWFETFDRDTIEVILFDDVRNRPGQVFARVLDRLSLDGQRLSPESLKDIETPSHTRAEIRAHRGLSDRPDFRVGAATIGRLVDIYADDIAATAALLDRSLDHWLDVDGLVESLVTQD